jgi:uncharacterized membrane protein YraQ (UPF0718 family)
MKKYIQKNKFLAIAIIGLIILTIVDIKLTYTALNHSFDNLIQMLLIVPPIFILIGLFDVWVERETVIKLMGENSGPKGMLLAFFIGAFSAGPTITAFPVAIIMIKKGAKYSNVLFFIMIWSSIKLPIVFFQVTTIGLKLTLIINITMLLVFIVSATLANKMFTKQEIELIEQKSLKI